MGSVAKTPAPADCALTAPARVPARLCAPALLPRPPAYPPAFARLRYTVCEITSWSGLSVMPSMAPSGFRREGVNTTLGPVEVSLVIGAT